MAALALSADEVAKLPVGKATCLKIGKKACIAYKSADGALKVTENACLHMGGQFVIEDTGKGARVGGGGHVPTARARARARTRIPAR